MEIKIVVDQISLDTAVAEVVRYDEDGDEYADGHMTVADKVAELIKADVVKRPEYQALKDRVVEIRNQEIREAVKPLIREALERPIKRTNTWGEPTGKETTLSEIILDEAKKVFTEPRDSYRSKTPWITEVIRTAVQDAFQKDIQEQVKKAREGIAKQLGTNVYQDVVKTALEALRAGK